MISKSLRKVAHAAVGLFLVAEGVALAAKSPHQFRAPSDPGIRVISIESSGGMRPESTRYEVFGDGRLVALAIPRNATGAPRLLFAEQLPLGELDALVEDLAGAGLMEYDEAAMNRRLEAAPLPTDQTGVHITLQLVSYDDLKPNGNGIVAKTFWLYAARVRAKQFPEIPELAAINRLLDHLAQIHRAHRVDAR